MSEFPTEEIDAAALEKGRLLFAQECKFVWGADKPSQLPPDSLPEIAFAGRSNVGKSSLINALTGRKSVARTSNTPGRTQQLNFFDLGARLMIVDLPGYGYAKVTKTKVEAWNSLIRMYLRGRVTLGRACVLIDSRHGLKDTDEEIMKMLDEAAVAYSVILTKADKPKPTELAQTRQKLEMQLKKHPAALPWVSVTSSETGHGIAELRAELAKLT